jgi:GMP reductase
MVPIFAANLDTTGTFAMGDALLQHNMFTCLNKHYDEDDIVDFFKVRDESNAFFTIGSSEEDFEKLVRMTDGRMPGYMWGICIDIANGYGDFFVDRVARVREKFPESIIMAGNVATPEMVQELLLVGKADIVKVGIGPGSLCETRNVAGVGYPQLSAIIECADAAHGIGGHICADGGCKTPGDVAKAFGAGADFVMLGGMFAGTDECEGEWVHDEKYERDTIELPGAFWEDMRPLLSAPGVGPLRKMDSDDIMYIDFEKRTRGHKVALKCHGMSSKVAQDKYCGGQKEYRASEGNEQEVPYKGPVDGVVREILGGIRSACAYVGASSLKDLPKCTTFVRVNRTK